MTKTPAAALDLFTAEQETADGWRLTLAGKLISYLYIRELEFAFEVWLGYDWDVTVKLRRPFTFGRGDDLDAYDPRTTQKSDLGPTLNLGNLEVAEFVVRKIGTLEISFSDGTRLVAGPADDGGAWVLAWPLDDVVRVAARPGGGLDWLKGSRGADHSLLSQTTECWPPLEPVRRNSIVELPIIGLVTESALSGASIELMVPIAGNASFCVHLGGELEIAEAGEAIWQGRGDADDRTSLGRVLGRVGTPIVAAESDEGDRLHLRFADGTQLTAFDRWEAHWPMAPESLDERWVPQEGPSVP